MKDNEKYKDTQKQRHTGTHTHTQRDEDRERERMGVAEGEKVSRKTGSRGGEGVAEEDAMRVAEGENVSAGESWDGHLEIGGDGDGVGRGAL
jgi:hypothetical protein